MKYKMNNESPQRDKVYRKLPLGGLGGFCARLFCLVALSLIASSVIAQPAARRAQQAQKTQKSNANNMTERAKIAFPTQQKMPEDVVWRRDLYRELDLTKDENGGLYYPVEPVGSQMNLFTYLFKLMLSGQITAYKYNLNGDESFTPDAKIKPLEFLDNYSIYYEKKDGRLKIDNSDIPSREVKSYYVKESSYYDQYTATYHTKVVALCPIMTREDDFGGQANTYPLFWVKYDDIAPFLSKQMIMTSNINNAAMMSIDDFFVKNKYKGDIYKTNNMLGQTLAQSIATTDSTDHATAIKKERAKIENQMKSFEKSIWGNQARKDSLDSIAKVEKDGKGKKKAKKTTRRSSTSTSEVKSTKTKSKSSAVSSGSARVSVRRQRH